ncbi:hypothetical protein CC2G_014356 [Coprinopsis cinerea AmutBmut pab1-1]|nr:hypothetical protein CC2G_014356 [Coprinopsis cinerea AmutBmut pab1-1]
MLEPLRTLTRRARSTLRKPRDEQLGGEESYVAGIASSSVQLETQTFNSHWPFTALAEYSLRTECSSWWSPIRIAEAIPHMVVNAASFRVLVLEILGSEPRCPRGYGG